MKALRIFSALIICPLLFWSCSTSRAVDLRIDPVAALSHSSEGAVPAAFAVIPPDFVLPALEEMKQGEGFAVPTYLADFLSEFFTRSECVFASVMLNTEADAIFYRVLAFGKFPARTFRLALNSSRGWKRRESGDAIWFESSSYMKGGVIRAAIPVSGLLLAEIDIVPPAGKREAAAASSPRDELIALSMEDFIAAASLRDSEAPAAREFSGAGEMFFSSVDAALLGAVNVPLVFYAPDFNLLVHSVLPAVPALPFASASALSALKVFSLPISSIELAIDESGSVSEEDAARIELLTVCAAVSSPLFLRPASIVLQLMFPGEKILAENGLIKVEKEMPAGSAALAILSLFSVS